MKLHILVLWGLVAALALFATTAIAGSNEGMITKKSKYSVTETIDRMEAALKKKGITIALRWSHSDRAKGAG
ncbi:MAG: hypothetical protein JSW10_06040, partial [Pseudomonadota bacterium]